MIPFPETDAQKAARLRAEAFRRMKEHDPTFTVDKLIDNEALWAYRYTKQTGQQVTDRFPSARIAVFKKLCMMEGDYKTKDEMEQESHQQSKGMGTFR